MLKQAQKLCREQAFIWGWWKWVHWLLLSVR